MAEDADLRMAALHAAARIYQGTAQHHATQEAAIGFYQWLAQGPAPVRMTITVGTPTLQGTGTTPPEGSSMQLHDNEQVTYTLSETDAKGNPVTGDTITWTVDNPAVVTLTPSADGYSCLVVAGTLGSAVVTVTDGTLSATEAVDVIAGPVAAISVAAGAVETQPAPAPATTPAAAPADGTVPAAPAAPTA